MMQCHTCRQWIEDLPCDCDDTPRRLQREKQALQDSLSVLEATRLDAVKLAAVYAEAARLISGLADWTLKSGVENLGLQLSQHGEQIRCLRGKVKENEEQLARHTATSPPTA